jgi:hypothetical protein
MPTTRKTFVSLVAVSGLALTCGLALGVMFADEHKEFTPRGFSFQKEVQVPLDPEAAFDAFTGDVKPWWDHRFSKDPVRMEIEPRPGGHFLEIFDEAGNGVTHGLVTWSERGKKLVIRGWLGPFHSSASTIVHTFTFAAADASTTIKADIRMSGEFDAQTVAAVDQVWNHFLVERFKPYAEGLQSEPRP